jgi:hypothetical protein
MGREESIKKEEEEDRVRGERIRIKMFKKADKPDIMIM